MAVTTTAADRTAAPRRRRPGRQRPGRQRPGQSGPGRRAAPARRAVPVHAPVAATVLELVDRSRASLLAACRTSSVSERYVEAHLAALRAAAALLAARSRPTRRSRLRSVWEVLPEVAPELTEWAVFFAATAQQRAALERGTRVPSTREADDLLRQSETFHGLIQACLGLPLSYPAARARGCDGTTVSEAFAHLHVASGFSLRYGASTPATLVERAAAHGQPALALTDRDGLYGAVRFVQACDEAGIAPVLGVDLAVSARRLLGRPRLLRPPPCPARPGCLRSHGRPAPRARPQGRANPGARRGRASTRATRASPSSPAGRRGGAAPGAGWGRLCRLVTSTHLSGERARRSAARRCSPSTRPTRRPGDLALTVLLGPDSDVGRALLARRPDRARALLHAWMDVLPRGSLVIEVVHHGGPEGTPASLGHAARLLGLAAEAGLPAVLTAAVRHADPGDAVTVDVLDAARRLVPLDPRHLDRVTTAGHLQLHRADAGRGPRGHPGRRRRGERRRDRRAGAGRPAAGRHRGAGSRLRPGLPHRPRDRRGAPARAVGPRPRPRPTCPRRCWRRGAAVRSPPATPGRAPPRCARSESRLDDELAGHRRARLPVLLPHRGRRSST